MTASNLFDVPGPKAKHRIVIITVLSVIAIIFALILAVNQFAINGQLEPSMWVEFTTWPIWRYLLTGLLNTLIAAGCAALIALPLGLLLAVGRLSSRRLLRWPSTIVIEVFRAIPLLLLIYIFFIALPQYGLNPDLFWKLVIPIGLCSAATIAEVFRAGILALPKGQAEAGSAIGLTESQTFWSIVFPQAVRMVIPSLLAQVVILLKDTTLGYAVSYSELQYSAKVLIASAGHLVQTYLIVTLIYIAINVLITKSAERLDKYMAAKRAG